MQRGQCWIAECLSSSIILHFFFFFKEVSHRTQWILLSFWSASLWDLPVSVSCNVGVTEDGHGIQFSKSGAQAVKAVYTQSHFSSPSFCVLTFSVCLCAILLSLCVNLLLTLIQILPSLGGSPCDNQRLPILFHILRVSLNKTKCTSCADYWELITDSVPW